MRRFRASVFVLPALGVAGCGGTPEVAKDSDRCSIQPPEIGHRLTASGTTFRDDLGRQVILRGVNAGGRSKIPPYVPFDFAESGFDASLADYFDRAQSWGIDVVRVPFTWAAVQPVKGQDDATFLARYDAILDAAWARGIWTIIDFHQDVYAENLCGDGFPGWTLPDPKPAPHADCPDWSVKYQNDPAVRAAFDAFWADGSPVQAAYDDLWKRLVERHRDRPGVIGFELINEPGWGTAQPLTFEATTLSAFFAKHVPQIRALAPRSLVFVEPTGLGGVLLATKLERPPGEGVVFAPHYYPINHPVDPEANQENLQKWVAVGEAWQAPVLVGELGAWNGADYAADQMRGVYQAFDLLLLSGTQWEYSVSSTLWNEERMSVVDADGTEHPVVEALMRPTPRAMAGEDLVTSWDPISRTLEIRYAPVSGGISEISLPARLYPDGPAIEVQGGCADSSRTGRLLVRADTGVSEVVVSVTPL